MGHAFIFDFANVASDAPFGLALNNGILLKIQ